MGGDDLTSPGTRAAPIRQSLPDQSLRQATLGRAAALRRICADRLHGQAHITRIRDGRLAIAPPATPDVLDLMSGAGEGWPAILKVFPRARITGIERDAARHHAAQRGRTPDQTGKLQSVCADIFDAPPAPESADYIISFFGLSELAPDQLSTLAGIIAATLKPGGAYALIDLSDSQVPGLGGLARWARKRSLGAAHAGLLGRAPADELAVALKDAGLQASALRHDAGLATSVAGLKPVAPTGTDD